MVNLIAFIEGNCIIFNRYYDITEETDTLTKTEATELRLREHFSHIINGVSIILLSVTIDVSNTHVIHFCKSTNYVIQFM